jgi:hypothetical protein
LLFQEKGRLELMGLHVGHDSGAIKVFLVERRANVVTSSAFRDHLLKLLHILYGWAFVTTSD